MRQPPIDLQQELVAESYWKLVRDIMLLFPDSGYLSIAINLPLAEQSLRVIETSACLEWKWNFFAMQKRFCFSSVLLDSSACFHHGHYWTGFTSHGSSGVFLLNKCWQGVLFAILSSLYDPIGTTSSVGSLAHQEIIQANCFTALPVA